MSTKASNYSFYSFRRLFIPAVVMIIIANIVIATAIAMSATRLDDAMQSAYKEMLELQALQQDVAYYDEVLTMSALMAASSGEKDWVERYNQYASPLDNAVLAILNHPSVVDKKDAALELQQVNNQLIELEDKAFKLISEGRRIEALAVLKSETYLKYKANYASELKQIKNHINSRKKNLASIIKKNNQLLNFSLMASLLFSLLFSGMILWLGKRYKEKNNEFNDQLEKEIQLRTQELENEKEINLRTSKLLIVGEIAGSIAHDIANPLTIIISKSSKLERLLQSNASLEEYGTTDLPSLKKSISQIERIIKNVKYLGHAGLEDSTEPLSAKELASECIQMISEKARKHQVSIEIMVQENSFLNIKKTQIVQLVVNFLSNAIDAVKEQNTKNVALEIDEGDSSFYIKVIDNGPGVPEAIKEKIFEPLFTTKQFGNGTGLGLTICKRIADSNGGVITMNRYEEKTIFQLEIKKQSPAKIA